MESQDNTISNKQKREQGNKIRHAEEENTLSLKKRKPGLGIQ